MNMGFPRLSSISNNNITPNGSGYQTAGSCTVCSEEIIYFKARNWEKGVNWLDYVIKIDSSQRSFCEDRKSQAVDSPF